MAPAPSSIPAGTTSRFTTTTSSWKTSSRRANRVAEAVHRAYFTRQPQPRVTRRRAAGGKAHPTVLRPAAPEQSAKPATGPGPHRRHGLPGAAVSISLKKKGKGRSVLGPCISHGAESRRAMRPVSAGRPVPSGPITFSPQEIPMIPLSWREWLKRARARFLQAGSRRPRREGPASSPADP